MTLEQFKNKVYIFLGIALLVSGFVSFSTYSVLSSWLKSNPEQAIQFIRYFKFIVITLILLQLWIIWYIHRGEKWRNPKLWFILFSVIEGLLLTPIFVVYEANSIILVFLISSVAFIFLSLVGWLTKKDLQPFNKFLIMGLVGLIILSVINLFWEQSIISNILTYGGLLLFAGLTIVDNQKIKQWYFNRGPSTELAIWLALELYLDFINLFLRFLEIFGIKKK